MNGKGDKPRKKSVDEKTWEKNWNRIFKKNNGVRVEIKSKDNKKEYGYILRRINVDNYEIWCEDSDKILYLCKEEFKELE